MERNNKESMAISEQRRGWKKPQGLDLVLGRTLREVMKGWRKAEDNEETGNQTNVDFNSTSTVPETNASYSSNKTNPLISPVKIIKRSVQINSRRARHTSNKSKKNNSSVRDGCSDLSTESILKQKFEYFYTPYSKRKINVVIPDVQSSEPKCNISEFKIQDKPSDRSEITQNLRQIDLCKSICFAKKQAKERKIITSKVFNRLSKTTSQSTNTDQDLDLNSTKKNLDPFLSYIEIINSSDIDQTYENLNSNVKERFINIMKQYSINTKTKYKYFNGRLLRRSHHRRIRQNYESKGNSKIVDSFDIWESLKLQSLKCSAKKEENHKSSNNKLDQFKLNRKLINENLLSKIKKNLQINDSCFLFCKRPIFTTMRDFNERNRQGYHENIKLS